MKLRLILISFVSLALVGGAGWYIYQTVASSGAPTPTTASQVAAQPGVQTVNGEMVVVVSPEEQRARPQRLVERTLAGTGGKTPRVRRKWLVHIPGFPRPVQPP